MNEWAARKFWEDVRITELSEGFGITLDGKYAMTPGKNPLIVPHFSLAEKICVEFQDQGQKIDPTTMPFTRRANTTIDRISDSKGEIVNSLLNYGHTDLVSYRANSPPDLVKWQSDHWDPVIAWLEKQLSIRMKINHGIIPFDQESQIIDAFAEKIETLDNFSLCGFSELVPLLGSLVLSFAYLYGFGNKDQIWRLSRIDEEWQEKKWGKDEQAQQVSQSHYEEYLVACFFVDLPGKIKPE
ncbi:MAG: ATPase [Rhodobacteraceae bacterium]|nr:ATPase [Paracoccaceae bacterium]